MEFLSNEAMCFNFIPKYSFVHVIKDIYVFHTYTEHFLTRCFLLCISNLCMTALSVRMCIPSYSCNYNLHCYRSRMKWVFWDFSSTCTCRYFNTLPAWWCIVKKIHPREEIENVKSPKLTKSQLQGPDCQTLQSQSY